MSSQEGGAVRGGREAGREGGGTREGEGEREEEREGREGKKGGRGERGTKRERLTTTFHQTEYPSPLTKLVDKQEQAGHKDHTHLSPIATNTSFWIHILHNKTETAEIII